MPRKTITKAAEESIKAEVKKQKNTLIKAEAEAEEKKKRSRPDRKEAMTPHLEPGDAGKFLSNSMQVAALPSIDTNNANEVANRINEYFNISIANDVKPSVAGLALALHTERQTLWRWINGIESNKPQEVRDTIKRAMAVLNLQMEDYMQNGKINPVSGIFLMKNNMGYQDKQEVVVTPNQVTESTENNLIEESNILNDDV